MSLDLMARLGQMKTTSGKSAGSGLGFFHARQAIEAWGGALVYESKMGRGTKVTFTLPTAPCPAWFLPKLDLKKVERIVILDDDITIHQIWRARLDPWLARFGGGRIVHCATFEELRVASSHGAASLYLIDQEITTSRRRGLDMIRRLKIAGQAVLVTSYSDDYDLQSMCAAEGVRMLPKFFVEHIPI